MPHKPNRKTANTSRTIKGIRTTQRDAKSPAQLEDRHRSTDTSLDSLRTLVAFADTGGVSAAARRLGVSQPVVSRKLQSLARNKTSGTILLRRKNGTLQLTEAAQSALPDVRELVRQYEQLIRFWNAAVPAALSVSLGVGHFAAEYYVPPALANIRQELPDCAVTAQVSRGSDRILGTFDGRFDLAIVSHDPAQITKLLRSDRGPRAELLVQEFAKQTLVVIASKNQAEGRELALIPSNESVPVRKLVDWELVGLDALSGIRRQLESRLKELQSRAQVTFAAEGGGWNAARELARYGLGAAIIPLASLRRDDQNSFTIRRLAPDFRLREFLIHRRELTATEKSVAHLLRAAAEDCVRQTEATWRKLWN